MSMLRVFRRSGAIVGAAWLLVGCGESIPESAMPPAQVAVATLTPSDVTLTEDLPGRVAALRTAEIRPQVGGIVQRRLFEQGAEIRAGQALFQIDPAPFKADSDLAEATLQRAQVSLTRAQVLAKRMESLVSEGAVSRQSYEDAVTERDQATAEVAQARATLARRQLDLKFATVAAPIDGRIDQALVTEGALVGPGDNGPMARIQQLDSVYVDVRQPASSLEPLRKALADKPSKSAGLPVAILRDNGEPYSVSGQILFSGVTVDPGTGDVLLRVLVDNPQRQLLPGMFVRARIARGNFPQALMVPQEAVIQGGGEARVWIVDEQNKAHTVSVQLGELIDRRYRIRAGLSAGQKIVTAGMERLADDVEVSAQEQSSHLASTSAQ